jgi:hypothetical protein
MGDYSQTMVAMRLKNLTKQEIEIIEVMIGDKEELTYALPEHPFFELRWKYLFTNPAYYLPVHKAIADFSHDGISNDYQLAIIGGIKWSGDEEMQLFIDWIKPKIEAHFSEGQKTFVGFTRYEHAEEPTLYYVENVDE